MALRAMIVFVALLGCHSTSFSRDAAFACARDEDCALGLVCLAEQCLPIGTEVPDAGHEQPDAGPVPPPQVLDVADASVRDGYGVHSHLVPIPRVARGNFVFLDVFARYSATPIDVPAGYQTLHESHAISTAGMTAEPRHVIFYRVATRNEDGGVLALDAYNTGGPPNAALSLGRSVVRAFTVSRGTLGTPTAQQLERGTPPFPAYDAPEGTLVLHWYAATAGTFVGVQPTSLGPPAVAYAYTPGAVHQVLLTVSLTSDAGVTDGGLVSGGGAYRELVSVSVSPL